MKWPAHIVRALWDALFPKRPDALVVESLSPRDLIDLSVLRKVDGITALLPFADARVRASVHELKYHRNEYALELLAAVLHTYIVQYADEQLVLLPVPLGARRRRKRGYNQVELVAGCALRGTAIRMETDVLIRTKDTKPQTTLARKERLSNVAEAFGVSDESFARRMLESRHIMILDDVTTTGATLKAAKAALSPLSPRSITCIALAH